MPSWTQRIRRVAADLLSLPPDAVNDTVSRLTCVDGKDVIVENLRSLLRVSETTVEIDLDDRVLLLHGTDFVVTLIAEREAHVTGDVDQITYLRKGGRRP